MSTWTICPGSIASLCYIVDPSGQRFSAVFLSKERGVVIGTRETPMGMHENNFPLPVQAAVNKHFGTVFALEHETWKGRGPSPRAVYCDEVQPWTVEA